MTVKEYTCVKKLKSKHIYTYLKPVNECVRKSGKEEKIEIEYYLVEKKVKYVLALYFLRGEKIIGVIFPYKNYQNNKI